MHGSDIPKLKKENTLFIFSCRQKKKVCGKKTKVFFVGALFEIPGEIVFGCKEEKSEKKKRI